MLSKANSKFIKSLQVKKYRKQEQCFTVEGAKSVQELLASDFEVISLFGTERFLRASQVGAGVEVVEVTENELAAVGEYKSNNAALAIARMKPNTPVRVMAAEFALVLDDINDPGNLGTIIRTADWFGIRSIVASPDTADFYNPKVIHATMGSFTRVRVFYTPLESYLSACTTRIFGAFLDGADVHQADFGKEGFIVIGSEAHGISAPVAALVTDRVTIPRYGYAESLNAGIATAVICDNLRRLSR
ncbi:MAG TPA: RNA methyltransferase [Chryseosolibacter sp.]|nr:RNA methyltransferase [Chryseosolibacter sp.]